MSFPFHTAKNSIGWSMYYNGLGPLYVFVYSLSLMYFPPWSFSVARLRGRQGRSVFKFGQERMQ